MPWRPRCSRQASISALRCGGAIFLLDPCLIVFAIGSRSSQLNTVTDAIRHQCFVAEFAAIVDIEPEDPKWFARVDDTNSTTLVIKPQTRLVADTEFRSYTTLEYKENRHSLAGDEYRESKRVRGSRRGVLCLCPRRSTICGGSFDDYWRRTSQYCKATRLDAVARSAR